MTTQARALNTISCPKCQRDAALMPDNSDPGVSHRGRCTVCGTVALAVETYGEDGLPVLQLVARKGPRPTTEASARRRQGGRR